MELWGLPLNAIVDEAIAYSLGSTILLRLLRLKKPKWHAVFLYLYFLTEVPSLYFRIHGDIYPDYMAQSARLAAFSGWLLTCYLLTGEGFWKILGAALFADFHGGICGILRMLTCMLCGIPMSDFRETAFRWDMKLIYIFYVVFSYLAIRKWIRWYQNREGDFHNIWKLSFLVYMLPLLFSPFTGLAVMRSDMALFHIGTASLVPLGVLICLLVVRLERSRRLRLENRSLLLQTSLFAEHEQVLLEQQGMINSLADWLEETRLAVPSAKLITKRRMQMEQDIYCTNGMVNLALCNKISQCEEQGITVNVDMDRVSLPKGLKEIDLLTILYNLFDNAARAAGECEKERRYISLRMHAEENRLELAMENGKNKEAEIHRKGGGQGLGIIEGTVKRYHGKAEYKEEAGRYIVKLQLEGEGQ